MKRAAMAKQLPRVLFLLQLPPPVHGAALRNESLVRSSLIQSAFNVRLLPLKFADDIEDIGKPSLAKLWRLVRFLGSLCREILGNRPRLVYFTLSPVGFAFYRDALIVCTLRVARIPVVYHLRGLGMRRACESRLARLVYRFVFGGSIVICLSKSHVADLDGLAYRKVLVVPNGILRESQVIPLPRNESPRLLFLSNYIETKGVLEFIEALRILAGRGVQFTANLVGADYDVRRESLQQIVESSGMEGFVRVNGPLFGREKFAAIHESDVCVFPTKLDLFPGVILEAMQVGRPIVTTPIGAIPEIVEDNVTAVFVRPGDALDLAAKLEILIADPQKRAMMAAAAAASFEAHFTLAAFEQNMKRTIEEVIQMTSIQAASLTDSS